MPLEEEFDREMHEIYRIGEDHGYRSVIFLQMIEKHGGVEAAKRLLATDDPQTGLFRLYDLHLLNHSMEALVMRDRYQSLFSAEEIATARTRLEELGFQG